MMVESNSFRTCKLCACHGAPVECQECHEVDYCSFEHKLLHWAKHKSICHRVKNVDATSVWIEVGKDAFEHLDEGTGMITFAFADKKQGTIFVASQYHNDISPPMVSPFAQILGWSVEIRCSASTNSHIFPALQNRGINLKTGVNHAGVYLGCEVPTGTSLYPHLDGVIYVTGRRIKDGELLTAADLRDILRFIRDSLIAINVCPDPVLTVMQWAQSYHHGWWQPVIKSSKNLTGGKTPICDENNVPWSQMRVS